MRIDKETGNTMWQDATAMDMKNLRVVFEEYEGA